MTASCHLNLDCGDLFLRLHAIVHLVDEVWLDFSTVFYVVWVCSSGGSFITATVSSKIDNVTRTSTISSTIRTDTLLAHELRLRTAVFAGVVHVTQRFPWLPFVLRILSVSSPFPSPDVFPRILTGSPSSHICSSFLL